MSVERQYIAIDLKSFYASVECVKRGLNPLETHLVVADPTRTEKTICLAVSPSLKAYGIGGRARLFEVVQRMYEVNLERLCFSPDGIFTGSSSQAPELQAHPDWEATYIVAPPHMKLYMEYSARIYRIYLRFVAPEDIFAYSVDEVFIDATNYLASYQLTAHQLAMKMVREVLKETGITATAGIGTNLYLSKVAMDIVAKHMPADSDGVRIAELDEATFRQHLWNHRPLTDFWRIGHGISHKLEAYGMQTLGDVARRSLTDPKMLYKLFGINAELLIDHAWGYEPCTMAAVKAYRPESNSLSMGQVLGEPYPVATARLVLREMADSLALKLVDKNLVTNQIIITINYDTESLNLLPKGKKKETDISLDYYGRPVPKHAHGTARLDRRTSSSRLIGNATIKLYDEITNPSFLVRRLNICACNVVQRPSKGTEAIPQQLTLFDNPSPQQEQTDQARQEALDRELRVQQAALSIKKKFGKNAILHGLNFEQGTTARERNRQIGGHKA